MRAKQLAISLGAILVTGLAAGCSTVSPWEKGQLADPHMFLDPDPMQSAFDSHIYFSKEASSGGGKASGGGCGCN